jgi:hypothetical protein
MAARPQAQRSARLGDPPCIGWDGNFWPVIGYLSGSFFARGVPNTYTAGGTSYCGAMYTFSADDFGGAPGAGSVQWTEDSGYLPAMTTTRTVGSVVISIKDFADKVTIGGNPFMLVYVRVAVTNNGSAAVTVPPGGSGPNLIRLTSTSLDTVQPGQTSNNDFVVAVDNFGTGAALPAGSALSSAAPSLDSAYSAMTSYWNGRVAETASFPAAQPHPAEHRQPGQPGDGPVQRAQGGHHLHADHAGRRGAVLRGQQLRLDPQPRRARRAPGQVRHRQLPRRAEPAAHRQDFRDDK